MTKITSPLPAFTRLPLWIFSADLPSVLWLSLIHPEMALLGIGHWTCRLEWFYTHRPGFPSFLFAVGNAMSFVMKRWDTLKQQEVLFKIFKRTILIFLVGYLMYWFPFFKIDAQSHILLSPISHTRIMGVLQRIALCYGIVALMVYYLGQRKQSGWGFLFIRILVALVSFWTGRSRIHNDRQCCTSSGYPFFVQVCW